MTLTRTAKFATALLAAVMITATLSLGSVAAAQPGGRRGPGGPGGPGFGPGGHFGGPFPALHALDLTDAQHEQVKAVLDQNKDEMRAIGEKLAAARKAQIDAIETVPSDEALIRATTNALATVEADAAVQRSKVYNAIYQILTPEQQEKLKTLKAEREKRGAEMRQRWQERRQQRQQATPPAGGVAGQV